MKHFPIALALVLSVHGSSFAQIVAENHVEIRQLVIDRDYGGVITELHVLESSDPKAYVEADYDYLMARAAESSGSIALAMEHHQAVVDRDSVLGGYALKHLAHISRSTGNLTLERLYLHQLLLLFPDSLLAGSTLLRLANNAFESGNYGETIRILNGGTLIGKGVAEAIDRSKERDIRALLGESYLRSGQSAPARDLFTQLLDSTPIPSQPDDVAVAAAKGLDLLDGGNEKTAPRLGDAEHLRRAHIYQFNREFAAAKLHLDAVIAANSNGESVANAMFLIGRGQVQQSEFAAAVNSFERILEQYSETASAKDSLLQVASAYARLSRSRESIARYQQYIDKYPTDEKLDRAYLNIVDVLRDQGEEGEAIRWCARTREAFKGKVPEALAAFAEARINIARENWPEALRLLDDLRAFNDLGGAVEPGGTNIAEITFLRGFVLEQLKRYAEAVDIYLSIADGRAEYYGWRATQRLQSLATDEVSGSFIAQKVGASAAGLRSEDVNTRRKHALNLLRLTESERLREDALAALRTEKTRPEVIAKKKSDAAEKRIDGRSPAGDHATRTPRTSIAGRLLHLELYDEAAPELELMQARTKTGYTLATYYKRGDRGDRAVAFMEPIWRGISSDHPIELMPGNQLELLYPAPYADLLLRHTTDRGVDPRLILAIMRQESRFQPDAKSYAAARGLMQFIAPTASRIAGELRREGFRQEDLYHPPTAILFGSQYLENLFRMFPKQPDAVSASYNGGEENMKRWLTRSRSALPDRYVPEIGYSQTKDYVYKVMSNYRMYQHIYDEQLVAR